MSLTSFLKIPNVKEKFNQEFQMPTFDYTGRILAPPITNNHALVGTAFDYFLRIHIRYINRDSLLRQGIVESRWVADKSLDMLRDAYIGESISESEMDEQYEYPFVPIHPDKVKILRKVADVIFRAKLYADDYIRTGVIVDDLYECALILAKLDEVMRSFRSDIDFFSYDKNDVVDLKNILSSVNDILFKAKHICILNPSFGEASRLVGGADADIIIDDTLIDIKTTKSLAFTREYFNQLMGYYILLKMRNCDIEGLEYKPRINKLGVYYSRFGYLYTFRVDKIVTSDPMNEFQKWFKKRAKQEYKDLLKF